MVDFETRSAADLPTVALANYAVHHTTSVVCIAWAMDDGPVRLWYAGEPFPEDLAAHVAAGGTVVGHNVAFELAIWNGALRRDYPALPRLAPAQCRCTLVAALAMGLPASLEDAAAALGLPAQKDAEGYMLMLRVSRPRRVEPDGRIVWWTDADKLERLGAYCRQDVEVTRMLLARLDPLSEAEQRVWLADRAINDRGAYFDRASVEGAVASLDEVTRRYNTRLAEVTAGAVPAVTAVGALKDWAAEHGVQVESLDRRTLPALIQSLPEGPVRTALSLRVEAGKASTAKLSAILASAGPDDRVRNMYAMNGAATGRWAGRRVQPHNLPRDVPGSAAEVEDVLALLRARQVELIDLMYGPPITMISRCLRPMFCAAPGHVLVGGDWSNVEGRGVAWFCGEEWKLQAFRDFDAGRGPDIYNVSYARTFDVPVSSVTPEQRQVGKVIELAFGYQGGVGAFRAMGGERLGIDDAMADRLKAGWRAAHPRVVRTWYALERAAIAAVRAPGTPHRAGAPGRHVTYLCRDGFLRCRLPSGRVLYYPDPKILDDTMLTYKSAPSANDKTKGKIVADPDAPNTTSWARVATYGGSLLENVVQAFCADFLRHLIVSAEAAGWPVVLHTHDECYAEVPEARSEAAVAWFRQAMNTPPAWAADFPLRADVEQTVRYGC